MDEQVRVEKVAHTPGPWNVDVDGNVGCILSATEAVVARAPRSDQVRGAAAWGANSKLLAAAPDLLSALQDLLAAVAADELIPESVSYMSNARAALRKAKGGAS